MRIDRLDRLALTVADQDATIDFYTRSTASICETPTET